jgi:hypothetical protein
LLPKIGLNFCAKFNKNMKKLITEPIAKKRLITTLLKKILIGI